GIRVAQIEYEGVGWHENPGAAVSIFSAVTAIASPSAAEQSVVGMCIGGHLYGRTALVRPGISAIASPIGARRVEVGVQRHFYGYACPIAGRESPQTLPTAVAVGARMARYRGCQSLRGGASRCGKQQDRDR